MKVRDGASGRRKESAPYRPRSGSGRGTVRPEGARRLGLVLLVAALVLFVAQAIHFLPYVNDDAYITFRYSRFLATGRGPFFNPGEHVEGYSNLLWMLLMAPVYALLGEGAVAPVAKGLGLLCGAASLVLSFLLCRWLSADEHRGSEGPDVAAPLAAGLLAVAPSFVLNSVSGLETAFFALLLTLGVLLGTVAAGDGRWRGAGVAFAAAALTRPEGPALFAVYAVAQAAASWSGATRDGLTAPREIARRLRPLILDLPIVAGATPAPYVFRWFAYDGEWLPNTYYAKIGGVGSMTSWMYIREGALPPFLGFAGIAAALVGWWLAGIRRREALPLVSIAVAGVLLPLATGPDSAGG
jgi:arabinofuranosyltransferase